MKNPTNTNAADAKEIQTQLAREKGGGRAYWNAVKKSKIFATPTGQHLLLAAYCFIPGFCRTVAHCTVKYSTALRGYDDEVPRFVCTAVCR